MGFINGHRRYVAMNNCERCGVEFKSDSPSSAKYCPECRKLVSAQQNRDRVRRFRERQKQKG